MALTRRSLDQCGLLASHAADSSQPHRTSGSMHFPDDRRTDHAIRVSTFGFRQCSVFSALPHRTSRIFRYRRPDRSVPANQCRHDLRLLVDRLAFSCLEPWDGFRTSATGRWGARVNSVPGFDALCHSGSSATTTLTTTASWPSPCRQDAPAHIGTKVGLPRSPSHTTSACGSAPGG